MRELLWRSHATSPGPFVAVRIVVAFPVEKRARGGQTHGAEQYPGKVELSVKIGVQSGFAGNFSNPSGLKLFGDFAYRMSDVVWFNVQLNQLVGFGFSGGTCYDNLGRGFPCGAVNTYYGGWDTEVAVGVKLKFKTPIPLVVEVPIGGAVEFLYARSCGDNGVAVPVLRAGGGVMYFLKKNIGVGGGFAFALGPGFHSSGTCGGSYTDFYGAFDFGVGAEFIL